MKVVIFCGGLGVRMGEATQNIPKPMIPVGNEPILWHIMRYFAAHGHTDFVLCLGYRAESIKEYFLRYNEALANDFVLSDGGRTVELLNRHMDNWRITFVGTGTRSPIGERLRRVRHHLEGEEMFLATYGDGLTAAPINELVSTLERSGKTGIFLSVRPRSTFHIVSAEDGVVTSIQDVKDTGLRINGGYFAFRRAIFDVLEKDEELVEQPLARLIAQRELLAFEYDGFFGPMDTIKDKQELDAMYESGDAPWRRVGQTA